MVAPASIIDAVESAASPRKVRIILKEHGRTLGTCEALFYRVSNLLGSDPQEARRLAKLAPLFLKLGDSQSWAQRTRAVFARLESQWARSAEAFREAGRLADNSVDRLAFQVGAVDSLARAGRVPDATLLASKLSRGLRRLKRPDLAARAELNAGNALLWEDRYGEARAWYRKALPNIDGLEQAMVKLGLSTAELFGGEAAHAAKLAEEAGHVFADSGLTHWADLCSINVAHGAILRGKADSALSLLASLQQRFEGASDFDQVRRLEFLGDCYLALNLPTEAEATYRAALARHGIRGYPLNRANCTLGLALAQRAAGNNRDSARGFLAAGRLYRRAGNSVWAAIANAERVDALLSFSRPGPLATQLNLALEELKTSGSQIPVIRAQLIKSKVEIALGQQPTELNAAFRKLRKFGLIHWEWQVHSLRSQSATGSKRLSHWRRMNGAIVDSRKMIRSYLAQSSYLEDKHVAIAEYIGFLLRRGKKLDVEEAVQTTSELRSIALLDEILSARELLSDAQVSQLEALRSEVTIAVGTDNFSGPLRKASGVASSLLSLQRRWIETTLQLRQSKPERGQLSAGTPMMVECGEELYVAEGNRAIQLPIGRNELRATLQRLQFELLDALMDPEADSRCVEAIMARLREALVEPWAPTEGIQSISPDGLGWAVPWQLLSDSEPTLLMSPHLSHQTGHQRLERPKRTVVWSHEAAELHHVRDEVESFLHCYPSAEVCRSLEQARKSLHSGPIDLLHVATHARINSENPMFSSLEFSGGALFAAELAQCSASFGLVVLSACETGTFSLQKRHEPDGLVRSFLARSASGVIGSSWMLDDESASIGFGQFYQSLYSGNSWLESLRKARLAIRGAKPHPFYWGAPVFFGGYRRLEGEHR